MGQLAACPLYDSNRVRIARFGQIQQFLAVVMLRMLMRLASPIVD